MTKEEAYTRLCHIALDYDIHGEDIDAVDIAISALDKQIPKKPIGFGGCPVCYQPMSTSPNYCPHCGQKLNWSNSND